MPKRMKPESRRLAALAYNDAVRDILRADGVFRLGDDESRDAVWEWDGVSWKRIPLVDRPVDIEPAREEELAIR